MRWIGLGSVQLLGTSTQKQGGFSRSESLNQDSVAFTVFLPVDLLLFMRLALHLTVYAVIPSRTFTEASVSFEQKEIHVLVRISVDELSGVPISRHSLT